MTDHIQATLNIGLDWPISEHAQGFDEEGEPVGVQIRTLGDAIIERAADKLVKALADKLTPAEGDLYWGGYNPAERFYREHVEEKLTARVDAAVEKLLADLPEVLKAALGEDSLEAAITKQVEKHLTKRSGYDGPTVLRKHINEATGIHAEVQVAKAVQQAKEAVISALTSTAEAELGKALRAAVKTSAGIR